MPTLWFILVAFMLTMYVVLDGFDLGAGAINLFAARSDKERRLILRAIGPVWDGNEVWLIAAGGTLFFSFPLLYASSFSGFYLPLMIVLWLLMLRGIAIELRSRIPSPIWCSFWDAVFFLGSSLLSVFLGAALGNVIRGVPLAKDATFFLPLWTDFLNPRSPTPGILDWYTVLVGLMAVSTLVLHGANYIAVKTLDALHDQAQQIARWAWVATVLLSILATLATFFIQPLVYASFTQRPWGVIFPLLALAGLVGSFVFHQRGNDLWALFSSGAFIVGMLASAAFSLYPNVLPAINPANSLTVINASASEYGQTVGLVWWIIGIVLASIYFIFTYRIFWGKVSVTDTGGH
ncbi:cytochrome oxidase d subunit II [Reticulibacter mediterranei]|uniref:Cytochrome oxidase d subunit II n=1 Tax=Reticulibacter mediterranei TaxID=2778369 RepID=A0A8J3IUB8_9CHLR|nr:cytochrome d ubiquinol oxidase subunit II [Reticulibacter mediterranei]GHP01007.1 cytochrome oxidase d subunit II [Reticulibacter mediterranei]